jgi:HAD superfamily hydrolase (TIGR01509 family)
MSSSGRQAVVFDLDGTLVDSLPHVLAAFTHALAPYMDRPITMEMFAQFGGPPWRLFPQLVRDRREVAGAMERLCDYNARHGQRPNLFAGVRPVLETLHAHGVQLAIWTGRDRASAQSILRLHRLEPLFAAVVCGDDLPSHKPDPAGLRLVLERLGAEPDQTLYLGDADVDVLAGHACGVPTVLIGGARQAADDVRRKAWREVTRPEEGYRLALEWAGAVLPGLSAC